MTNHLKLVGTEQADEPTRTLPFPTPRQRARMTGPANPWATDLIPDPETALDQVQERLDRLRDLLFAAPSTTGRPPFAA